MNAARSLFRMYGIKKISMHDVADKAGVSPATIYNHFENKQDLVDQVVQMQLASLVEMFTREIRSDKPYLERMEILLFNEEQFIAGLSGEMGNEAAFRELRSKTPTDFVWYEDARQALLDFINLGKELGYIDRSVTNRTILIFLEITWRGITSLSYGEKLVKRKDIIHDMINYLFKSKVKDIEELPVRKE